MPTPRPPRSRFLPAVKRRGDRGLTFTFRLSAVVSSNSFPSSKEISVVLMELWVLMSRWAPSALMLIVGFSNAARCRSEGATPGVQSRRHTSVQEEGPTPASEGN